MNKTKFKELLYIIFGSALVALVVATIHSKTQLTEGGQIGIELLLLHWFNISPSVNSIVIDLFFYILGFFILNQKFRVNAIIGTLTYEFDKILEDIFQNYVEVISELIKQKVETIKNVKLNIQICFT